MDLELPGAVGAVDSGGASMILAASILQWVGIVGNGLLLGYCASLICQEHGPVLYLRMKRRLRHVVEQFEFAFVRGPGQPARPGSVAGSPVGSSDDLSNGRPRPLSLDAENPAATKGKHNEV